MGSPDFAVPALDAVHRAHQVVGVYSQPDRPVGRGLEVSAPPVKRRAQALGLPVFQPERLSLPGELGRLQALAPDVIVVVAYGQLLKRDVLAAPRLGCVNIHSSLLPRWRGAAPIQRAILSGDVESGVTTMRMVEKLDAGDILLQERTPIDAEDTAGVLHDRLAAIGASLIVRTLDGLEAGSLQGHSQDETKVTYAAKLTKEMEWLDLKEPAAVLDRRVRALNPWPGTSVMVRGAAEGGAAERLKVRSARLRSDIQGAAGSLFQRAGMVLLGTPKGALELLSVQWEGKKAVDAAGFLNGLRGRGRSLPLETANPEG